MLHEDRSLLEAVVRRAAEELGVRETHVEKDYYVCLVLAEIAAREDVAPAYFKGGTALYKMLPRMERFSEDVDLTVPLDGLASNSQRSKRLRDVALGLRCLPIDKDDPDYDNRKGSITSVYRYEPVTGDLFDPLERFGRVKVEATSFGVSQPTEDLPVETLIARAIDPGLASEIGLPSCIVPTLTLERIFADKCFAAEGYLRAGRMLDAAKHVFDLCVMVEQPRIAALSGDGESVTRAFAYRREEEAVRLDSNLQEERLSDGFFLRCYGDESFMREFRRMQDVYVFTTDGRLSEDDLRMRLPQVGDICRLDESYR